MKLLAIIIAIVVFVILYIFLDKIGFDEMLERKFFKSSNGKIRYKNLVFHNPGYKNRKIKTVFKMISGIDLIGVSVILINDNLNGVLLQSPSEISDLYNKEKIDKIFNYIEKNNLGDTIALTSFKFRNVDLW